MLHDEDNRVMAQTGKELKVSIIIPVYGVSAYIERCIKSVMSQTCHGLECIIVDDATPDDSIVKCKQMIDAYHGPIRFSILHHQQNRGLSAARNTGTEAATGDYFFYLDSDDALAPDCIEKLLRPILNDKTIEIVQGRCKRHSDGYPLPLIQSKELQEGDYTTPETIRNLYFNKRNFSVAAWNKLIKREFLIQNHLYFKEGILWEDTLWTFFVLKHLSHLYIIPDYTYYYYKRPQSITTGTSKEERACHWGIVFEEIANHLTLGEEKREVEYYVRGFCVLYTYNSNNKRFQDVSRRFGEVLSIWNSPSQKILLLVTRFLSKTLIGRKLFSAARRIYHLRHKLKCIKFS